MVTELNLEPGDAVVDIGSNDGTFLRAFQSLGMEVLGIEGSEKPAGKAIESGIPTLSCFFGKGLGSTIRDKLPRDSKIRLVTAMNVLAHTDNINEFLPEVAGLMEDETTFVSQSHWLAELTRKFEFDTIYHEHLRYYTLASLTYLLQRHGLSIFDAETTDFYGGSILTRARKEAVEPTDSLLSVLSQEQGMDIPQALRDMKQQLLVNKARLIGLLVDIKEAGQHVIGVGAPMKASTLLNFYGVTSDLVDYLTEVNELKVGTVVPGVRIPVVDERNAFQDQPEYAMLLSWNMADAIIPKYRSEGFKGKFIVPVPRVEVIE